MSRDDPPRGLAGEAAADPLWQDLRPEVRAAVVSTIDERIADERFVYRRKINYDVDYLFKLDQEEGERLGDWHNRFFTAVDNVQESTPGEVMFAFRRGLKPGHMKNSLILEPPSDYADLCSRLHGYMRLEEWTLRYGKEEKPRWSEGSMPFLPWRCDDANYIFSLEQGEDEALGAWFDRFFRALSKVQELSRREAFSAFRRGLNTKAWDLKKSLILEPPMDYGDLSKRVRLEEQEQWIEDTIGKEQVEVGAKRKRPRLNRRRTSRRTY